MIASYLRVSTDEQRERQTIETQRSEIALYCAREKITNVQEFADDGESGTIPFAKRRQSRKLLEAAKQGSVECVIVYRLDRLGRDHADTYSAIGELLRRGVKVFSLKEGWSENTASGRFRTGILTLVAQHERDTTVERSVDASLRLAKDGVWLGGIVPYGYRVQGKDRDARLAKATEPIPGCDVSEGQVIERIFQSASEGNSCGVIVKELRLRAIPGKWSASRIRNIIVSKTYKGIHEWGKRCQARDEDGGKHLKATPPEKWITRPCPPIVDERLWDAANAFLHRNQIAAMAHAKNDYLLRGLIRCSLCGLTYSGMTGSHKFYYHRKRENRERCPSPCIHGEELEAAVWSDIEVFVAKPGAVIRQLEEQIAAGDGQGNRVANEIKELETALARNVENRSDLVTLLTDKFITPADFKQQEQRLGEKIVGIEQRLAELRTIAADADRDTRKLGAARSLLEDLREKTRRQVVEALVNRITVSAVEGRKPEIRVVYVFDPDHKRYGQQWNGSLAPRYTGARADSN